MNKLDKELKFVNNYMEINSGKVSWYKAVELINRLEQSGWKMPIHETVNDFIKRGGTITKLPYFAHEEDIDLDDPGSKYFISY